MSWGQERISTIELSHREFKCMSEVVAAARVIVAKGRTKDFERLREAIIEHDKIMEKL